MKQTQFDFTKRQWTTRTTDRLPRHDLYFGMPLNQPWAGLPIGDGDMGSLVWLEKDAIHIHIGKTDLWQDAIPGTTYDDRCYNSGWEECHTMQKHGGELIIRFDSPFFDYMYQKAYSARLSLTDAAAIIQAQTPMGNVSARVFGSGENRVTVLRCRMESEEPEAPEITFRRFGSRTLWRWYCQQKHSPEIGLDGTEVYAEDNCIFITQELNATKFCLGLMFVSDTDHASAVRKNRHSGLMTLDEDKTHDFCLYYTIRIAETTDAAKALCAAALGEAAAAGEDALYEAHRSAWETFWNKSHIALADDYLENLYYLFLYYLNSESRGAYPPHFTSGVWGWYHDYLPWVYYFHFNMQHLYAPLDAAGHGDLAQNYYRMRRNGLDAAYQYGEIAKKKHGAFYHDVCDRYSRGADYDMHNASVGAQIVMQMYRHYRYTGDKAFLSHTVLPIMNGVAEYYLSILEMGGDGLYHTHDTTCYEGGLPLNDTITDKIMILQLFSVLRDYAEPELRQKLDDVLAHLPPFETEPLSIGDDWDGNTFLYGIGKGQAPVGDGHVFTIGYDDNGKRYRRTYGNGKRIHETIVDAAFPDCDYAPLYPAGIFGIKDRGSHLYDCLYNQMQLHDLTNMHWGMFPIFTARMGMADAFLDAAHAAIKAFQHFPCGFNVESDGEFPAIGKFLKIRNTLNDHETRMRHDDFVHFDFETVPVLAQGITDALMQSHEGLIRLCPAVRSQDAVSFALYAEGGFLVQAEVDSKDYVITVDSLRGEALYLRLPEYSDAGTLHAYRYAAGSTEAVPFVPKMTVRGREEVYDFSDLACGETVLLTSVPLDALQTYSAAPAAPNMDMKTCGIASLGLPHLLD